MNNLEILRRLRAALDKKAEARRIASEINQKSSAYEIQAVSLTLALAKKDNSDIANEIDEVINHLSPKK